MNATKIEYLDFTWSPLIGCSGDNCAVFDKCWARYQAKRQYHKCLDCYIFSPHKHFERLNQPLQVKSQKLIGACFSADMWDRGFSIQDRKQVFSIAIEAKQHWFINLTKQPQNIPEDLAFPKNWVQGVSVCVKKDLDRIETLKKTKAPLKAISFEPLYEDLGDIDLDGIDWVIIGAQTHPLKSPEPDWIQNILSSTIGYSYYLPIFMKNNLNPYDSYKEYPAKFGIEYCEIKGQDSK